jgi:hypothetical protein
MFNFIFKITCLGIIAFGAHTVWQGRGAAVEVVVASVAAPMVDGSVKAITGSLDGYMAGLVKSAPDSIGAGVKSHVNHMMDSLGK